MPNEEYRPTSVSEQDANGVSVNSDDIDKATSKILDTKAPLKPKPQINTSHAQNSPIPLNVFHQNIRAKPNELISQLYPSFPHILCIMEHHMNHSELQQIFFDNCKLGASYCRSSFEKGGVCIFVQENLWYIKLDLQKHCKDKDFEVYATKVRFNTRQANIIAIYRSPSGNFNFFITKLDVILRQLYTVTAEFIICGDINIDYLADSDRKRQLEVLLKTYNLTSVVNFPKRIEKHSATAIDNIFIDTHKMSDYSICPIINGLSDHDAQSILIRSYNLRPPSKKYRFVRKINEYTLHDFLIKFSYENWDTVFSTDDVNMMFNSFLDTYIKIANASFPLKRVSIIKTNTKN